MQRNRSEQCACPGAKVLRGDVFTRNLFEVSVDVGRGDVPADPFLVDVFKQLLARQLLARLDDVSDTPVFHAQQPLFTALAGEAKANFVAINGNVPILYRVVNP